MKVRVSIPGAYVAMELEDEMAQQVFAELGGALLRAKTMPVKMAPRVEVVRDKAEAIQEVAEETVDQEVPLVLEGAAEEKPDQDIIEQSEEC